MCLFKNKFFGVRFLNDLSEWSQFFDTVIYQVRGCMFLSLFPVGALLFTKMCFPRICVWSCPRLCWCLCVSGASSLRTPGGAVQLSQFGCVALQRNPSIPLLPVAAWQQTRHSSFFNKCMYMKRLLNLNVTYGTNTSALFLCVALQHHL